MKTEIERFEYMKVHIGLIPKEIIDQYDLTKIACNGWEYLEIQKGMYGLPHAGILVNNKLKAYLATFGYYPTKFTPGLWTHESRDITFALIVDNFFIKYTDVKDAHHLLTALKAQYTTSEDWDAKLYCGFKLDWDYKKRTCQSSMLGYVQEALTSFQHSKPSRA